jgi:hypothetical protein
MFLHARVESMFHIIIWWQHNVVSSIMDSAHHVSQMKNKMEPSSLTITSISLSSITHRKQLIYLGN